MPSFNLAQINIPQATVDKVESNVQVPVDSEVKD